MAIRTKGEQKAYLDGYEMCAECIEKYLSAEGKKQLECLLSAVRNAVEIEDISALSEEDNTMEWISAKVGKLFPSNDYKCSKCGNILDFDGVNCGRGDAKFCPNCGRRAVQK
jgi:membrane protease subunit (stomatin/prohibitin family)